MAKLTLLSYNAGSKTKRPGIHAKTKTSKSKNATNYKKQYRGQGK